MLYRESMNVLKGEKERESDKKSFVMINTKSIYYTVAIWEK